MKSLSCVLLLGAANTVYGWGELGHRTVAYLAEKHLTPAASKWVNGLLKNEKDWDISDAAIWPDSVRKKDPWKHTGPWHYIDAKDDPLNGNCSMNYSRDCEPEEGCIVSAIANMTERVRNTTLPRPQQEEALMFLLHFFGDIHQPLHTETLQAGGNGIKVCFDEPCKRGDPKKENLHGIWDSDIPHTYRGLNRSEQDDKILKKAAATWATELSASTITPADLKEAECSNLTTAQDCALSWATEVNTYICSYVLKPGVKWLTTHDLLNEVVDDGSERPYTYYQNAVPIVERLVQKGGLRLAGWLNALAETVEYGGEEVFRVQENMEV